MAVTTGLDLVTRPVGACTGTQPRNRTSITGFGDRRSSVELAASGCNVGNMTNADLIMAHLGVRRDERSPFTLTHEGVEHTITPILGGWCIKDLPSGDCVDVMKMIFNWRVVRSQKAPDGEHWFHDRGWCYTGTGPGTMLIAIIAAIEWDGGNATEPEHGWIKRVL